MPSNLSGFRTALANVDKCVQKHGSNGFSTSRELSRVVFASLFCAIVHFLLLELPPLGFMYAVEPHKSTKVKRTIKTLYKGFNFYKLNKVFFQLIKEKGEDKFSDIPVFK